MTHDPSTGFETSVSPSRWQAYRYYMKSSHRKNSLASLATYLILVVRFYQAFEGQSYYYRDVLAWVVDQLGYETNLFVETYGCDMYSKEALRSLLDGYWKAF